MTQLQLPGRGWLGSSRSVPPSSLLDDGDHGGESVKVRCAPFALVRSVTALAIPAQFGVLSGKGEPKGGGRRRGAREREAAAAGPLGVCLARGYEGRASIAECGGLHRQTGFWSGDGGFLVSDGSGTRQRGGGVCGRIGRDIGPSICAAPRGGIGAASRWRIRPGSSWFGRALAAAIVMRRWIGRHCAGDRSIGLLLPASVGGALANLGVALAGKTRSI